MYGGVTVFIEALQYDLIAGPRVLLGAGAWREQKPLLNRTITDGFSQGT